jgi:hypothetical protein
MRLYRTSRYRMEDKKINLRKIGCEGGEQIELAQDSV